MAATENRRAVLLDAMGTLVELEPPAPRLVEELRRRWQLTITADQAKRAFASEIRYYKAHHVEGRDSRSVAALRQRCAAVLHAALPVSARDRIAAAEIEPALLASLRFHLYPDVADSLRALRAAGLKLAVVSNWDVSLGDVLADLGAAELVDCIVTSAEVGAPKPAPTVFRRALERLDAEPSDALHVGDSPELDLAGARAAGIESILIRRGEHDPPAAETRQIDSLAELLEDAEPPPRGSATAASTSSPQSLTSTPDGS